MKIIIYALGKVYEREKNRIDFRQVIALADKSAYFGMERDGLPVISPAEICGTDCDYIAIFSGQYYEDIRMELTGEYCVPEDKIIPWTEIVKEESKNMIQILERYRLYLNISGYKRILDVGMSVLPDFYLSKDHFLSAKDAVLDGLYGDSAIFSDGLYDNVYRNYVDCTEEYDVALLWGEWNYISLRLDEIWKSKFKIKYFMLHTGYLQGDMAAKKEFGKKLQKYGKVAAVSDLWGILWIIDTRNIQNVNHQKDMSIYVVTHKNYNVITNQLYIPLCVGGFQKPGYLNEQIGDNIAYLNTKINECTALYWIWKNTDTEYVGLNHYRRYFYNNGIKSADNYLDGMRIFEILSEYDIILAKVTPIGHLTIYEQIYHSINHELCEKGYSAIRRGIEEHQSEYLQAFDDVMNGHSMFRCNIFVTKRAILNKYCEWLFSFLIEAAEQVDVEGYDNYSQRAIGFFAERMWTVWLRKNKLKIKEMPYTDAF